MKRLLIGLMILSSMSVVAGTDVANEYYKCQESGLSILVHVSSSGAKGIYNFGGQSNGCNKVALNLNAQILQSGEAASYFDCRGRNLVSNLGTIAHEDWEGFICSKLALALNRSL